MSKSGKLLKKLLANPTPVTFTYQDLVKMMSSFGYVTSERGSGSRVCFYHSKTKAVHYMHKPHPGNELKKYQVLQLIEFLREQGDLDD